MNSICRARLGAAFPDEGVGKRWTDHFVEKFSDWLGTYWARPLDNARGRAVNPITNAAWFDLLGKTLAGMLGVREEGGPEIEGLEDWEKEPIKQECTHGVDESGFWPAGGTQERVIGAQGKKCQHKQGDGG